MGCWALSCTGHITCETGLDSFLSPPVKFPKINQETIHACVSSKSFPVIFKRDWNLGPSAPQLSALTTLPRHLRVSAGSTTGVQLCKFWKKKEEEEEKAKNRDNIREDQSVDEFIYHYVTSPCSKHILKLHFI